MAKQPEYEIQRGGEFYTVRSRHRDKPLRVQSPEIPVEPIVGDNEQASGGPVGRTDMLAWKTKRRGLVWKFGIGEFPLPQGETIYSNAVVAHAPEQASEQEPEQQLQQDSLWGDIA